MRQIIRLIFFIIFTLLLSAPVFSDQQGKYITLETKNKQSFRIYVVGPLNANRGILLIHGWLGLNKGIEVLANSFARTGYRAMALDLYHGEVATNSKDARKLMTSVIQSDANAKYSAALNRLKTPGRKLATIGWSYGGSQALYATLSAPDLVSATVSYYPYGEMISDKKTLAPMKGPMLIQAASQDFAFTPAMAQKYKVAINNAGKKLEIHTYDAKHSFDKPKGNHYNKNAHEMADRSTYEFLNKYLR